MKHASEVAIPQTPNFIRRKDDGFPIPIAEFSDEELLEIGRLWTRELLIKAQNRRDLSKDEQP